MKYILFFALSVFFISDLFAQQKTTYFNHTQVSFLIGEESDDELQKATIPSFQTVNGLRFSEHWALGLGVGVEPFEYLVYPVFLSGYYFFNISAKHRPFISIKAGHAFSKSSKIINNYNYSYYGDFTHKGGLMFNPEIGFRFKLNDVDMTLSGGYRFQRLNSEVKQKGTTTIYKHEAEYNRVSFTIGILF